MFLELAIVAGALAIFYISGWGLTRILLGDELRTWVWCVGPWTGMAVIILVTSLLALLGIGTKHSGPACLLFGLGLLCAARWKLPSYSAWAQIKTHKKFLVPCFVLLFAGFLPVAWLTDSPTTLSYGNNDPATYALVADYLHDQGVYPPPPVNAEVPYFSQPVTVIKRMPRWGAPLLLSSVDSILGLEGYESFNLILLAIAGCLPLALYLFSKVALEQSDWVALLATLFLALNVNILWVLYHGFLAQVIALGLLIIGLTLSVRTLEKGISKPTLLGAILSSALMGSYPEILPFLVGPLALYSGLLFARQRGRAWKPILRVGLLGLMIVAVFPFYLKNAVQVLFVQSGVHPGWDLPRYASLPEALGIWNVHILPKLNAWILIPLTLILLFLLLRAVLLSKRRLLWFAIIASYSPILLYTRLIFPYSYGYYKAITFCLFATVTLLAGSFEPIGRGWQKALSRVGSLSLLGLLVFGSYGLAKDYIRLHHAVVDPNLVQLSQLGFQETPVYLREEPYWNQLWAVYFLGARRVTLSAATNYLWISSVREHSRPNEIVVASTSSQDIIKFEPTSKEIYLKNKKYVVGKFPTPLISIFGTGWWGVENHIPGVTFRWMSQDAVLRIDAAEGVKQSMRMETFSYGKARQLQVFVNDELVGEYPVAHGTPEHTQLLETEPFAFRPGQNIIRLHAVDGPVPAGGNDPRHLSLGIASIEFLTVKTP